VADGSDQLRLFGPGPMVRRSRRATDQAVRQLRRLHRLEPVDVGQVAMLRTLADLLDAEVSSPERSAWTAARLVAEWRALWGDLTGRAESGLDEELRAFFTDPDAPVTS
jgi:hypothetical protein